MLGTLTVGITEAKNREKEKERSTDENRKADRITEQNRGRAINRKKKRGAQHERTTRREDRQSSLVPLDFIARVLNTLPRGFDLPGSY